MRWVRVQSAHTIHLSMCLQSYVEELLRLRSKRPIKKYLRLARFVLLFSCS